MTDETEIPDDEEEFEEGELYEAQPIPVSDGEAVIFDVWEFADLTNSLAAMVRDGCLYVLKRETLKWVSVEQSIQPAAVVRSIPTRQ